MDLLKMEFSFRYRFEAAHRFLNSSSTPCMTPHGHTWHATLHLRSKKTELNGENMVMEFSKSKASWKKFVADTLDHSYLCNHKDPLLEPLLVATPDARILPFPGDPTTEIIALFVFSKVEKLLASTDIKDSLYVHGITIEETPTNSIFCDREFYLEVIGKFTQYRGWWNSEEITDRSFKVVETSTN
jgi:6-pyruvoyl-tetrahydropterin synthase